MNFIHVPRNEVQPGDIADHVSRDLDPREVVTVNHDIGYVTLRLFGIESIPLLIENYTYKRWVGVDSTT